MIVKLDFVEIVVDDIDSAVRWYQDKLGFSVVGEIVSNEDGKWVRLCLNESEDIYALWEARVLPTDDTRKISNFVLVFLVEDLDEEVSRLSNLGVKIFEPIRDREVYRITSIRDCSGNLIQLYEKK